MTALDHMPLILVTGTDTDAGKTVATAVLAAALKNAGELAVIKPCQTGLGPDDPTGDVDIVRQLAGLDSAQCHEFVRLPEPLAPTTAARRAGVTLPSARELAARIVEIAQQSDHTIVEGAGGVLVGLDSDGATIIDLGDALRELGAEPQYVVVCRAGLGSLNHTELTAAALRGRGHDVAGLVIGAWPKDYDLASECNLTDLPALTGLPLLACIPDGIGADPQAVQRYALELA